MACCPFALQAWPHLHVRFPLGGTQSTDTRLALATHVPEVESMPLIPSEPKSVVVVLALLTSVIPLVVLLTGIFLTGGAVYANTRTPSGSMIPPLAGSRMVVPTFPTEPCTVASLRRMDSRWWRSVWDHRNNSRWARSSTVP